MGERLRRSLRVERASAVRAWRKGLDRLEEGSDRGRLAGDLDAFSLSIARSSCGQKSSERRVRRGDRDVRGRLGVCIGAEIPSGPVAGEGVVVRSRHVHEPAHTPDVDAFALKLQPEGVQDVLGVDRLVRPRPFGNMPQSPEQELVECRL